MAVAAGVKAMPAYAPGFASFGNNFAVPALFLHMFPAWFAGVAFAAIAIGALVPASIMSIACGNLFTRNIYKDFIAPDCTPGAGSAASPSWRRWRSSWARCCSCWSCRPPTPSSCNCWAASGSCQTVPAVLLALYVRLNPMGASGGLGGGHGGRHLDGLDAGLQKLDLCAASFGLAIPCYAALSALVLNLLRGAGVVEPECVNADCRHASARPRRRGSGLRLTH